MARAETIRAAYARATRAAQALRAIDANARAELIADVARELCDAPSAMLERLAASSGLSVDNVAWGLRTTFEIFDAQALVALATRNAEDRVRALGAPGATVGSGAGPRQVRPITVVLAGNVLTACARPLLLPLLCGVPVIAKASSHDDALPRALQAALAAADARLGEACQVLTFAHTDSDAERALLGAVLGIGQQGAGTPDPARAADDEAACLNVYGSDETIAAWRRGLEAAAAAAQTGVAARAAANSAAAASAAAATGEHERGGDADPDVKAVRVIGHGHGLGLCYVTRDALASRGREVARALAIDVTAYDQRGCLSPHAVYVEGDPATADAFAAQLHEALQARERSHPRGALPPEAAAEQLQWRGVARALGTLREGKAHAVSHENSTTLRASPGYRNIAIHPCDGEPTLRATARQLGPHLKALGVAADAHTLQHLSQLAPHTCPPGEMQRPPLATKLDGLAPLEGAGITAS